MKNAKTSLARIINERKGEIQHVEGKIKLIKETILNIAKQLNVKIDKIILFGSRARDDYKEDSDWDILVVTEEKLNREKELDFTTRISLELQTFIEQDVELITVDKKTFEQHKTPAYVYYYAEKEGKLLWYNKINEDVKYLLERALEELRVVDHFKSEDLYYQICPFCSWTVRDLLKAFLIFNQQFDFSNDLVELAKLCMEVDKEFKEKFERFIDVFEKLKKYDASFKNYINVDREEAQKVIDFVEKVKIFVLKKLVSEE